MGERASDQTAATTMAACRTSGWSRRATPAITGRSDVGARTQRLMRGLWMPRRGALGVGVELRRLAAIELAVVAHHADETMAQLLDGLDLLRRPCLCGAR